MVVPMAKASGFAANIPGWGHGVSRCGIVYVFGTWAWVGDIRSVWGMSDICVALVLLLKVLCSVGFKFFFKKL